MALAIDASSPVAATATTVSKATASFTPPANSLIVAVVSVGNSTGSGLTTGTVTDSLGSTWTMKKRQNVSGGPSAEVWMMDAGASPAARTVTITGTATIGKGVQIAVLVFTGAAALASQTGASGSANGSAYSVSVTTTTAGSYVVGAFARSDSGVALTANASTTALLSTNDATNGETYGVFRATNATVTPGATTFGYTNTAAATNELAAWEVLASTVTSTPISSGDTGSGADAGSLAATLSSADTGSGVETASLAVTLSAADAGTSAETGKIAVASGDTGTGADSASASVAVSVSDTGTLTDAVAALGATLTALDTGSGVEGGTANRPVSDGDTGSGADVAVRIAFTAGDTGSGVEGGLVTNPVSSGDTGSFVDAVRKMAFGASDAGTFAEAASVGGIRIRGADTGTLTDRAVSIVKSVQFFRPPIVNERYKFAGRTSRTQAVGVTILKTAGSYVSYIDPTAEEVQAADIAYLGGRDYPINDTEKAALIAAGYGSYIVAKEIIG